MLLAAACPAGAAKPFTLATDGEKADVAVDDTGTAHFVWNDDHQTGEAGQSHDITRYCQVPRNATACTKPQAFPLDGVVVSGNNDNAGPKVLLDDGGDTVVILTQRCCNNSGGRLIAMVSEDRGTSFAPPRQIGTNEPSGDAMLGPGGFSISTISSVTTGGVRFQAAPLDQVTTSEANVGDRGSAPDAANDGALALVDPLRPVAAMSDLDNAFLRFGPSQNWNDVANWSAPLNMGPGQDTNMAFGARGAWVMYLTGTPGQRRYVVRKVGSLGFGDTTPVSAPGSPSFSDFSQDPKGQLHAVWDGDDGGNPALQYRLHDGAKWQDRKALTTESEAGVSGFFHNRIDAARDGGGFVVFDDNGPPLKAIQFGPTKKLDPNAPDDEDEGECLPTLKVGAAQLVAGEKCFAKQKGGLYTTTGGFRMNGIEIEAPTSVTTTIDKKARTLSSGAKNVTARVGNVVLGEQPLGLRAPATPGPLQDLAGNPAAFDTEKANVKFLGLPVSGLVMPTLGAKGKVELPFHLGLPTPFDSLISTNVTADTTLVADNSKIYIQGIKVHLEDVWLGIASIKTFDLAYTADPFRLDGESKIVLPVVASELDTQFRLINGEFDYGKADLKFKPPGRPITDTVYLNSINFLVQGKSNKQPTRIAGGVVLTGGPTVPGLDEALVRIGGTVGYTFPSAPTPGVFRAEGTGFLAGFKVATVFAQYETSGKISFGSNFHLGSQALGIGADVNGIFHPPSGQFQLDGAGNVCVPIPNPLTLKEYTCLEAKGVVSSTGVAGCAGGDDIGLGAGYKWGKAFEFLSSCDLGSYQPFGSVARIAQSGAQSFSVGAGQRFAGLAVRGTTASPRIAVVGPRGERIESPANPAVGTSGSAGLLFPDTRARITYVLLRKPSAGTWRVEQLQNSSPIASLSRSRALPEPRVRGRIGGRGAERTLSWTVRAIPGQRVSFFEEGRGVARRLGVAKGKSGKLRISPAPLGPGGKRSITALVEQNGLPRDKLKVTSYTAPPAPLPGRPRFVRAARRGGALVVTWGRSRGAKRYALHYSLRTGRERTIVTRKRRARIAGVPNIDAGRITVAGLRRDNAAGKRRQALVRAQPRFRIARVAVGRGGRAVLTVQVPQAGRLSAVARARGVVVARGAARSGRAGGVKVALRPTGAGRRVVGRAGRLRTRVVVRYAPQGAQASQQARRVSLRR